MAICAVASPRQNACWKNRFRPKAYRGRPALRGNASALGDAALIAHGNPVDIRDAVFVDAADRSAKAVAR